MSHPCHCASHPARALRSLAAAPPTLSNHRFPFSAVAHKKCVIFSGPDLSKEVNVMQFADCFFEQGPESSCSANGIVCSKSSTDLSRKKACCAAQARLSGVRKNSSQNSLVRAMLAPTARRKSRGEFTCMCRSHVEGSTHCLQQLLPSIVDMKSRTPISRSRVWRPRWAFESCCKRCNSGSDMPSAIALLACRCTCAADRLPSAQSCSKPTASLLTFGGSSPASSAAAAALCRMPPLRTTRRV